MLAMRRVAWDAYPSIISTQSISRPCGYKVMAMIHTVLPWRFHWGSQASEAFQAHLISMEILHHSRR